jgi:hypothetical protein
MKTTNTIKEMATKAANNAIKNNCDSVMYSGDFADDAIYSVSGLIDDILETYFDDYSDQKPTQSLFDDLAFDLVS